MRNGLLGSLLGLPGRTRRISLSNGPTARYRRPSLEGLETRTLPSILTAAGADAIRETASSVAQPANTLFTSSDQGQGGMVGSQNEVQQDGQAGAGPTVIRSQLQTLVELRFQPVDLVPVQYGRPQEQQGQIPDSDGQATLPIVGQGDSQTGQSDSSDDGSVNFVDNSQSDQPIDPNTGQSEQSDNGQTDPADSSDQGESNPAGSPHDGSHCHRTADGSSAGQSGQQAVSVDPSQTDPADQGTATGQNSTAGQESPILGSSSDGKMSSSPPDPLAGNPEASPVADAGTGTSTLGNNQTGSFDKRQHSSSNASLLEVEQRSPASVQDAKPHGPDGTFATADEVHGPVAMKAPGAEPRSRNQDGQSQQQALTEDPAQKPLAERLRGVDVPRGSGTAETPSSPSEEAVVVGDFLDDSAGAAESLNVSPQKHGLLTDSLSLEISSLRSQVQRFFEHIDQLGAQTTDRQTGLVLCSVAVVAAAAMAGELAWRQARRPVANAPLGLATPLAWADDAEAPAAIGLPYVGQFSTLS